MSKYRRILLLLVFALCLGSLFGCGAKGIDYKGLGYTAEVVFDFNSEDAVLTLDVTEKKDSIKYYFKPGEKVFDPTKAEKFSLTRRDYDFVRWTTDKAGEEPWDFNTELKAGTVTLYAQWKAKTKYTYTLYYVEGDSEVEVGSYTVSAGDKFNKNKIKRNGFTALNYYSNKALSTAWDFDYGHPGGETDTQIKVYAEYIENIGDKDWTLVSTATELVNALNGDKTHKSVANIYLLNDIDCSGKSLNMNISSEYTGVFEGNGKTVTNLKVPAGTASLCYVSLFGKLSGSAEVKNVTFDGIEFYTPKATGKYSVIKAAALAVSADDDVKINNVTVNGTFKVLNSRMDDGVLDEAKLNGAVFEDTSAEISGFTASISVSRVDSL